MMRRSPYSIYDDQYKSDLDVIHSKCGLTGSTDIPTSPITPDPQLQSTCVSGNNYTTRAGDSCDSIASANSVSSAALFIANSLLIDDCNAISGDVILCLPLACSITYMFTANESCATIENNEANDLENGEVRAFNPWIFYDGENLQDTVPFYGSTLCLSPHAHVARLGTCTTMCRVS